MWQVKCDNCGGDLKTMVNEEYKSVFVDIETGVLTVCQSCQRMSQAVHTKFAFCSEKCMKAFFLKRWGKKKSKKPDSSTSSHVYASPDEGYPM